VAHHAGVTWIADQLLQRCRRTRQTSSRMVL
jgi:hypothetical protein